jgi:hypothetical protein
MERRQPDSEAPKSLNPAPAISHGISQWPPTGMRPLSDIREITEPSLIDIRRPSKETIPVKLHEAGRIDRSQYLAQGCGVDRPEAAFENTIGGEWLVVVLQHTGTIDLLRRSAIQCAEEVIVTTAYPQNT